MRTITNLVWCGLSIALVGCTAHEESLPKDVTDAIESCVAHEDPQGCTALYTDDAEISGPGAEPLKGKAAILQFYKEQIHPDLQMYTDTRTNIVQGSLGVTEGSYRIRNLNTRTFVEQGQYLNVLQRRNGEWKVFRSMFIEHEGPKASISVGPP